MSQVSYGTITITDTTDIERIYTVYAKSANNTTVPSIAKESWSENVSTAPGTGNYIWQRTVVEKSGTGDKTYSDPVCLTGEEGTDATEISGIEVRYGISVDWNTQPASWSADTPAYDSSKPKYWTRTRLIYDTNPVTYSNSVYTKDEALTKAVSDAAIANSVAQHANEDAQGAMSQSANGIASIYRVWYRTNTATAPSKPPAHVTSAADDVNNTWTTVKPKENTDNRYYFYCEETVTNGGVSSWTNPVLDTSNLSQYEIGVLTTKVKNFWWNSDGAHIASGINGADVDKNSPVSAYGFNSLVGLTGISFGYNNAKVIDLNTTPSPTSLKFYQPPTISGSTVTQGALAMELSSNALKFYGSSTSTPDASLSSTGLNLAKGSITLGDYFSVTNTGELTAESGTIGGWSFTDAALYYSDATPGYSATNLVISKSSAVNTNAIAGSETNKHWFLAAGRKFGVDTEGNLYANNAHLSSATVEGAITATQLTISGGGATYDGASAINANGYTIEIIEDETAAPTGSVLTETQTYLYPVMYLNGVAVTTGITKTNYIWYTNENTATTGGVAGDSTNGGIIATYGNTYRVTYDLSDDAVGTTPSQSTIHTSDARHITDISSSGITIHPEDGTAGNYMQLDSDGLKIYKSSTLLANYGTTITIGSSSAKNVYIDSNGVQIRDSATSLAEFGTTARIGQSTSSRFLVNSDSLQAYGHDNSLYFEVNSNGLTWGSGNTAATTTQVDTAARTATNFITNIDNDGIRIHDAHTSNNSIVINSDGMEIFQGGNSVAKYGSTSRIGPTSDVANSSHLEILPTKMTLYGINKYKEQGSLLELGDLRGIAVVETYTADGYTSYNFGPKERWATTADIPSDFTVYVNDVVQTYETDYTFIEVTSRYGNYLAVNLSRAPSAGAVVKLTYTINQSMPYTTFGTRKQNSELGRYSIAVGKECEASEKYSSAIGFDVHATGEGAFAEGFYTVASGKYSHAEGDGTVASGYASHAQNAGTIASESFQTVIGKYNASDTDALFIIGKGYNDNGRSNALVARYNGDLIIAGGLTQSSDRRLKDHQSYLSTDAINFIQNLKPAHFKKDNQFHVGFYAQDVESIDPWNCMVGEMNGFKTLGYTEIIAPLVAYCQHLEKRINDLESQNRGGKE